MSTRRPPLASVPNATNSPHRGGNPAAVKRPRTGSQLDLAFGQPPPKKQLIDRDEASRSPAKPRTALSYQTTEGRVFSRRSNSTQLTAFEKKLVGVKDRERQPQLRNMKMEKPSVETLDNIRQWQKHYRKAFPSFVFYFDSIPADLRSRSLREVLALGAVSFSVLVILQCLAATILYELLLAFTYLFFFFSRIPDTDNVLAMCSGRKGSSLGL
jgi:regulatory subunit for Cdc7p protein kinase